MTRRPGTEAIQQPAVAVRKLVESKAIRETSLCVSLLLVSCRFTGVNLLIPLAHHRGDWFWEESSDPSRLPPLAASRFPWWCRVVKPPPRTKTLSTKVSENRFAQPEAAVSERGLSPSEWCRETLLASVNGQEPKASDPGGPAMLSWPNWWRCGKSCSTCCFKLANDQTLTAEEMQRLIDRADSDKSSKARERLLQAQESGGNGKKNPDRFLIWSSIRRVGAVGDEPSIGSR
jgi:hypothetical protein